MGMNGLEGFAIADLSAKGLARPHCKQLNEYIDSPPIPSRPFAPFRPRSPYLAPFIDSPYRQPLFAQLQLSAHHRPVAQPVRGVPKLAD